MVQINFAQKTVSVKIVYYGPGMSGKTTNLEIVHQRAPDSNRGDLTSIATDGDRTLFFDFMPLDLGTVAGMRTQFQIYTVPGQVYYNSTRKLVLQGVDGVIFVADSSNSMMEENLESLRNLQENLQEYGKDINSVPYVIQYNKRDLPDAMSVEELQAQLNPQGVPHYEAVANTGQGVFPTLKALAAIVLDSIHKNQGGGSAQAEAPAPAPAAMPAPAQAHAPAPVHEAAPPMQQAPPPAPMQPAMPEPAAQAPAAPFPNAEPAPAAAAPEEAAPNLAMANVPPQAAAQQAPAQPPMPMAQGATGFHPQANAAPAANPMMDPAAAAQPQQPQQGGGLHLQPRQQPAMGQTGMYPQNSLPPMPNAPMSATGFHQGMQQQQQPQAAMPQAPQQPPQAQPHPAMQQQPQQQPQPGFPQPQGQQAVGGGASLESTNLRMRPQLPTEGAAAPQQHAAPAPSSRSVPAPRQGGGQGGRLKPRNQARPTPKNSARKRSAALTAIFIIVALGAGVALGGTVFNLF